MRPHKPCHACHNSASFSLEVPYAELCAHSSPDNLLWLLFVRPSQAWRPTGGSVRWEYAVAVYNHAAFSQQYADDKP